MKSQFDPLQGHVEMSHDIVMRGARRVDGKRITVHIGNWSDTPPVLTGIAYAIEKDRPAIVPKNEGRPPEGRPSMSKGTLPYDNSALALLQFRPDLSLTEADSFRRIAVALRRQASGKQTTY